jgi:hypothetical protein
MTLNLNLICCRLRLEAESVGVDEQQELRDLDRALVRGCFQPMFTVWIPDMSEVSFANEVGRRTLFRRF